MTSKRSHVIERQRTEIQPDAWLLCFRCKKPTFVYELVPWVDVTTSSYTWWGFPLTKWKQVVSICWTCEQQELAAERVRKARVLLGAGGFGLLLFGWQYVGIAGLIGAVVATVYGIYRQKRNTKQLTEWRTPHA